jgi:hypothetical protein
VYKVLAEAPDPYPLLEAAVVRPSRCSFYFSFGSSSPFVPSPCPHLILSLLVLPFLRLAAPLTHRKHPQDQTVKVSQSLELESELLRTRTENIELRKKIAELGNIEAAKRKVDGRVEVLEGKVRFSLVSFSFPFFFWWGEARMGFFAGFGVI